MYGVACTAVFLKVICPAPTTSTANLGEECDLPVRRACRAKTTHASGRCWSLQGPWPSRSLVAAQPGALPTGLHCTTAWSSQPDWLSGSPLVSFWSCNLSALIGNGNPQSALEMSAHGISVPNLKKHASPPSIVAQWIASHHRRGNSQMFPAPAAWNWSLQQWTGLARDSLNSLEYSVHHFTSVQLQRSCTAPFRPPVPWSGSRGDAHSCHRCSSANTLQSGQLVLATSKSVRPVSPTGHISSTDVDSTQSTV